MTTFAEISESLMAWANRLEGKYYTCNTKELAEGLRAIASRVERREVIEGVEVSIIVEPPPAGDRRSWYTMRTLVVKHGDPCRSGDWVRGQAIISYHGNQGREAMIEAEVRDSMDARRRTICVPASTPRVLDVVTLWAVRMIVLISRQTREIDALDDDVLATLSGARRLP